MERINEEALDRILKTFVQVDTLDQDNFLKVKETLTRMGVANKEGDTLFQSCHILHKRGKYYVVLFKELFLLDGRSAELTEEDLARRNTIAHNLQRWNMIKILNPDIAASPVLGGRGGLTIIPFSQKSKWKLVPKYTIGKKS